MRTSLVLLAAGLFAGCGGGSVDDSIKIESITPAFSPLSGGTHVVIKGQGFLRDGAPPNHVVIGTTEAPLAAASDDTTLEVDTPPGAMPGDVPVVVFNRNGQATAMGMFHYSTGPTITGVSPSEVMFDTASTTVTVTGTGFMDEGAGVTTVLIDGQPALDVTVTSDTQLTFTALPGTPMAAVNVSVTNARGTANKDRAFRYIFSTNPTLVLFPKFNTTTYMVLYDPTTSMSLTVKNRTGLQTGYRAVVADADGNFWAIQNRAQNDNNFGKIDFDKQQLEMPIVLNGRINALARQGSSVFAVERNTGTFGGFDLATGIYTPISANNTFPCCNNGNLASDGTNMFAVGQNTISKVNITTGAKSASVALNPPTQIDEMHFAGTTLFGVNNAGNVFSINTANGAVTTVTQFPGLSLSSFEVFTPGGTTP